MTHPTTRAWFDGALSESGRAAFGFLVAHDARVVATCSTFLESCPGIGAPDSVATELAGLSAVLKHLIVTEATGEIVVYGDCAPVIAVVCGYNRICDRYQQQVATIQAMLMLLPPIRFEWIPRSLNHRAHNLAAAALKNHEHMRPLEDTDANGNTNAKPKAKLETNGRPRRCPRLRRRLRQFLSRMCDRI